MKYLLTISAFFFGSLAFSSSAISQIVIPAKVNIDGLKIRQTTKEYILKKYGKPSHDDTVMGYRRFSHVEDGHKMKWLVEKVGHKLVYEKLGMEFTFYTNEVNTNKSETLHSVIFTKKSGAVTNDGIQVGVHTVKDLHSKLAGQKFSPMPLRLGLLMREKGYHIWVSQDLRSKSEPYKNAQKVNRIEVFHMSVIKRR